MTKFLTCSALTPALSHQMGEGESLAAYLKC